MNSVEEMLMKIYWKLWTSADFESDFQSNWLAVYRKMQTGDHYGIPEAVIKMCFQYFIDWEASRAG